MFVSEAEVQTSKLPFRFLALPTKNRISWIGMQWTNTLAYYENWKITDRIFLVKNHLTGRHFGRQALDVHLTDV
jgi:hypothetical protein